MSLEEELLYCKVRVGHNQVRVPFVVLCSVLLLWECGAAEGRKTSAEVEVEGEGEGEGELKN